MPLRKRFLLALALCLALACCGYSAAGQEEVTPPARMQPIDRTDFPNLYLTNPALEGEAVWMLQARLRE